MQFIQPVLKLCMLTAILANSANAQLFRRNDDSAAEKAKLQQQQQLKAQQELRQKQAAANSATAGNNRSAGNPSGQAGQGNRNTNSVQPSKSGLQRSGVPQSNTANLRGQSQPRTNNTPSSKSTGVFSIPQPPTASNSQPTLAPSVPSSMLSTRRVPSTVDPQRTRNPQASDAGNNEANANSTVIANSIPSAQVDAFQPGPIESRNQPAEESSSNKGNSKSNEGNVQSQALVSDSAIEERFGVNFSANHDEILVDQLIPAGFAVAAGLRVGDKITMIGGAPVSTRNEFYEIARLLALGDRIEIEFERAGKNEKSEIQYGESTSKGDPKAETTGTIQLEGNTDGWTPASASNTERLEQMVVKQQLIIQQLEARIRQLEAEQSKSF